MVQQSLTKLKAKTSSIYGRFSTYNMVFGFGRKYHHWGEVGLSIFDVLSKQKSPRAYIDR